MKFITIKSVLKITC